MGDEQPLEAMQGETILGLSLTQQQTIVALLEKSKVSEVAQEVGVHPATIYKWLKQSDFKAAYREAKRQAMARANARLQQAAEEAVAVLQEIMKDAHVQPAARVGAAKIILDKAQDAQANEDLAARVEALEGESDTEGAEDE